MADNATLDPNPLVRPDVASDDLGVEKDWESYDNCEFCVGRAQIRETLESDLFCEQCRARLPRPEV